MTTPARNARTSSSPFIGPSRSRRRGRTRWGEPGVDLDRTSAPSCAKRGGGGPRFLFGRLGHAIAQPAQPVSLVWKCAHARGADVVRENGIRYPNRTTANAATPIRTPSVFRITSLMSTARDGKATMSFVASH